MLNDFLLNLVLGLALVYFLPFLIAWGRGVLWPGDVFKDNLLFGWTVIGWFYALRKALTMVKKVPDK